MRLTLRTLLAYLDDILEPAQAQELGRKINGAPVAQDLTKRIREVVRKRRLGAPTLEGPESGLDPNVVAEYLDNQLTSPQVSQTERVLLNSEMHLAEAASAHQILTLILGEPVEVVPNSRRRMYALGPQPASNQLAADDIPETPPIETVQNGHAAPEPLSETAEEEAVSQLVRQRTRNRRLLVGGGIAALAACWIGLLMMGGDGAGETTTPNNNLVAALPAGNPLKGNGPVPVPPQDQPAPADIGTVDPAEAPNPTPETTAADSSTEDVPTVVANTDDKTADVTDVAPPVDVGVQDSIDAPPPADVPSTPAAEPAAMPAVAMPDGAAKDDPEPDTSAPPAKPVVIEEPADPAGNTKPVADADPADKTEKIKPTPPKPTPNHAAIQYASLTGVLLRHVPDQQLWQRVEIDAQIRHGDRLASPQPFVSELAVGTNLRLYMGPGSRGRWQGKAGQIGFDLEEGTLVLVRTASGEAGTSTGDVTFRLTAGKRSWDVVLPSSETKAGFAVAATPPQRLEKIHEKCPFKVWVVGGQGSVTIRGEEDKKINAGDRVALAAPEPGTSLVEPGGGEAWMVAPDPVSSWMHGRKSPTAKRYAKLFAAEFTQSDGTFDMMLPLLTSRRPWMSQRAVQCLAITEQCTGLVRALARAEHAEAMDAAITGLRSWLPRHPENGPELRAALEQEFNDNDSEALYRLLWGFDEDHGRDQQTSRDLVDWLVHDKSAIRNLAYFHITRLTGQQDQYRANLSDERRSNIYKKWKRTIERQGGLLPQ